LPGTPICFALYDEAVHFAAEASGVTSFESNLVLLMDLLLLEATGLNRRFQNNFSQAKVPRPGLIFNGQTVRCLITREMVVNHANYSIC
jgi:hypothetical protein